MLIRSLILTTFVAAATAGASGAEPQTPVTRVELRSSYFSPGIPLAGSVHPVHALHIEAHVKGRARAASP